MTAFIRLTRIDNAPVLVNVTSIIAAEEERDGSTTIYLKGEGELEQEVQETVDRIQALLAEKGVSS